MASLPETPVSESEGVKLQAAKPLRDPLASLAPELPQPHNDELPYHGHDREVLLPRCLCSGSPAGP